MTSLVCLGSQNDVSVYGNLLFVSVESDGAKKRLHASTPGRRPPRRASAASASSTSRTSSNPSVQVDGVQTCRGSHTHTLRDAEERPEQRLHLRLGHVVVVRRDRAIAGLQRDNAPATDPNPSLWRIEVIKVPLANPSAAPRSSTSRACSPTEATGRIDGLQNAPQTPNHPCASAVPACVGAGSSNTGGATWAPTPITNACHDITVYEEIDLAAGACEGNGLLVDISDPANPKRIDAVADPLFAYWHGATFSNDGKAVLFTDEWGGGNDARCRATDQLSWGADAIYEIVNKKLVFRSYYKLPVAQTTAENCVSHVGNLVPGPRQEHHGPGLVPGRRLADRLDEPVDAEGDRLLRPRTGQTRRAARPRAASGRRTGTTADLRHRARARP